MIPIEIIAVLFAVLILCKVIIWILFPQKLMRLAQKMVKHIPLVTGIYGIATLIIGYYIVQAFSIIEVAAIGLFIALLIKMGMMPLAQELLKNKKSLQEYQKRCWFPLLIWTIFALWTLIALLK